MQCRSNLPFKNLNHKVQVQSRGMVGSHIGVVDLVEQFVDLGVLWGEFKTAGRGYQSFGGVGVSEKVTHIFVTRYTNVIRVTDQEWILHDNMRYKVDSIENINEEKKFLRIYLIKQGSLDLPANDG